MNRDYDNRYRNQSYGNRRQNYNRPADDRGWWERTTDEVSSWLGDEEATRRRQRDTGNLDARNNDPHNYPTGYQPTEANPYYPLTNRIYERGDNEHSSRNSQQRNHGSSSGSRSIERSNRGYANQQAPRAGNLMTRDVATVHPNDTAQFAARMMRDHDCGAIPVIERQGRIIGMVTDRDITVRLVASGADIRFAQVQDCMTDEVFACHVDDSLESCMRQMSQHQIRRLPVVDNYDRIVGIISQSDLAQYAEDHQDRRGGFTDMIAEVSERSKDSYR